MDEQMEGEKKTINVKVIWGIVATIFIGVGLFFNTASAVINPEDIPLQFQNLTQEEFDNLTPEQEQEFIDSLIQAEKTITESTNIVADVNIYEAQILSEENNIVTLSFDIANGLGVQSGVKYGVQLIKDDENGGQILADEKVYSENMDLSEGERIHKEITYTIPSYLDGTYNVWIISENTSGLILGLANAGSVTTNVGQEFIEIDASSCYLVIGAESDGTRYSLIQGVDISSNESLIAYCTIINHFDKEITVSPQYKTYLRTIFGEEVTTPEANISSYTLAPKETQQSMPFPLAKADKPQAYDVSMQLVDEGGMSISNTVTFHYVIQGESATIQNLILDKDSYKKKDTAHISFFWAGSADGFPGSRSGEGTTLDSTKLTVSIFDENGNSCANSTTKDIIEGNLERVDLLIPITKNCDSPIVTATLENSSGVLDEKTYNSAIESTRNSGMLLLLVSLLIVVFGIYVYIKKNNNNNNTFSILLLSLLFGGALVFIPTDRAEAVSFSSNGATYTANLNKSDYVPGETIVVSGTARGY